MKTSLWSVVSLALIACGDPAGTTDESSSATADEASAGTDDADESSAGTEAAESGSESGTSEPVTTGDDPELCAQVPLPCEDAAIQDLSLQKKVSAGVLSGAADGDDWVNQVDATAGGTMNAAMNAWHYLRFTDKGLVKVEIDDLAALTSSDWDIAAKRYGIRVNSGSSGPSCVTVATGTGDYASITEAPADAAFAVENYYTADCTIVPDSHTLGDPDYRMAAWWAYEGCVKTTGVPFVLRLADGRAVKLVIEAYYAEGQAACNDTNTMGSGSAMMTWRWAYLP